MYQTDKLCIFVLLEFIDNSPLILVDEDVYIPRQSYCYYYHTPMQYECNLVDCKEFLSTTTTHL